MTPEEVADEVRRLAEENKRLLAENAGLKNVVKEALGRPTSSVERELREHGINLDGPEDLVDALLDADWNRAFVILVHEACSRGFSVAGAGGRMSLIWDGGEAKSEHRDRVVALVDTMRIYAQRDEDESHESPTTEAP